MLQPPFRIPTVVGTLPPPGPALKQAESLKALHREQLSLVAQRLEQVVARKDGTIAALKAELQRVTDKLRKFEGLLVYAGDARGAARGL